ncbi:VanW family protein [Pelotalea chapellei]|nr:VanW family protein [Pelotalea chapellei]
MKSRLILAILALSLLVTAATAAAEGYTHLWGGFSTPLAGRSPQQRHNAARAAADLNGIIVPPGATLSLNDILGVRLAEKGYEIAPMVTDKGTLEDVTGGGICQIASTIYNAALDAGLQVVERHPHSRVVHYVPPGRDATVAGWLKDLKVRNPHEVPLQLGMDASSERLTAAFRGIRPKNFRVELKTEIIPLEPETAVVSSSKWAVSPQKGGSGYSALTRRIIRSGDRVQDEVLSRDRYPAPTRLVGGGGR